MGIQKGDKVKWNWGSSNAFGKVVDTFTSRIKRTINGTEIVRNGSNENKALLIEQDDNQRVLKLESEVKKNS